MPLPRLRRLLCAMDVIAWVTPSRTAAERKSHGLTPLGERLTIQVGALRFAVDAPPAQGTIADTKFTPFGVPTPVTSSQPAPVCKDESVPKVMTYQRVEYGLL